MNKDCIFIERTKGDIPVWRCHALNMLFCKQSDKCAFYKSKHEYRWESGVGGGVKKIES